VQGAGRWTGPLLVSSAALQHRQKLGKDVCRRDACVSAGVMAAPQAAIAAL